MKKFIKQYKSYQHLIRNQVKISYMEFVNWIDRSLNEVNKTSVFLNFFGNIDLEQIEDRLYLENGEQCSLY